MTTFVYDQTEKDVDSEEEKEILTLDKIRSVPQKLKITGM